MASNKIILFVWTLQLILFRMYAAVNLIVIIFFSYRLIRIIIMLTALYIPCFNLLIMFSRLYVVSFENNYASQVFSRSWFYLIWKHLCFSRFHTECPKISSCFRCFRKNVNLGFISSFFFQLFPKNYYLMHFWFFFYLFSVSCRSGRMNM